MQDTKEIINEYNALCGELNKMPDGTLGESNMLTEIRFMCDLLNRTPGSTRYMTDSEQMTMYMNRPDTIQSGRVYSHGIVNYVEEK